jgi:hypothetical protein
MHFMVSHLQVVIEPRNNTADVQYAHLFITGSTLPPSPMFFSQSSSVIWPFEKDIVEPQPTL